MKKVNHTYRLTPEDKVDISFMKDRGKIRNFSINYSSFIGGKWCDIRRIDNCHGSKPHRHTFHLHKEEYRIVLNGDNNQIFTEHKRDIIANFREMKENYLRTKQRNT